MFVEINFNLELRQKKLNVVEGRNEGGIRERKGFEEHGAKRAAKKLHEEKDDLLAYMRFPKANGKRLRTVNSVERLNRELNRRTNVVGVFPDRASILRLGGSEVHP